MKIVDVSCPSCGATLQLNDDDLGSPIKCSYCGKTVMLDDEVSKVEHTFVNAEQAGYEFQKGKLRADKEEKEEVTDFSQSSGKGKSEKHTNLIKILLWILLFPIMIIYKIITSSKMDFETKVILIVLIGGAIVYFMSGGRLWS